MVTLQFCELLAHSQISLQILTAHILEAYSTLTFVFQSQAASCDLLWAEGLAAEPGAFRAVHKLQASDQ